MTTQDPMHRQSRHPNYLETRIGSELSIMKPSIFQLEPVLVSFSDTPAPFIPWPGMRPLQPTFGIREVVGDGVFVPGIVTVASGGSVFLR